MARIVVAGGGIGGLAAAISLGSRRHEVVVLERRDDFSELGAGIQLAPNAFHALDSLEVGEQVRARAVFIDALRLMDGRTEDVLVRMPLTEAYRQRFGNPYAVVHRNDLYRPLLEACRSMRTVELRCNSSVEQYRQDSDGVTVITGGGERCCGDALVGADGIRSAVRWQLVGDGRPRVSGHTIYRSVIPMELVPEGLRWNSVTLWAGPGWHFVHYPIAGGEHLNLAATLDDGAQQAVFGQPVEREHVRGQFPELADTPRRLLELGRDWRSWVLCDRDPVRRWTDGRVTLLGDAAHPMLQYAAQGACMALEDAVLIGELVAEPECDVAGRLAEYEAERRVRTAQVQLVSRQIGEHLYHPAGAAAQARDEMLAAHTAEEDLYERVAWLHGAGDSQHAHAR